MTAEAVMATSRVCQESVQSRVSIIRNMPCLVVINSGICLIACNPTHNETLLCRGRNFGQYFTGRHNLICNYNSLTNPFALMNLTLKLIIITVK